LASHDGGRTFKIIQETLIDLGFHVKYKVLNTMEYGNVPQNRECIYSRLQREKIIFQTDEDLQGYKSKDQDELLLDLAFNKRGELIKYYKSLKQNINPLFNSIAK